MDSLVLSDANDSVAALLKPAVPVGIARSDECMVFAIHFHDDFQFAREEVDNAPADDLLTLEAGAELLRVEVAPKSVFARRGMQTHHAGVMLKFESVK